MSLDDGTNSVESELQHCRPISTFEELLEWNTNCDLIWPNQVIRKAPTTSFKIEGFGRNCHQSENIFSPYPRIIGHTAPKTIFCHDFKGGYLNDKYPDGCPGDDNYVFFHWAGIDTFIYFSHHLVTIPPLAWLNAAHRNGVSVLGTFITENETGEHTCEKIISDPAIMEKVIDNLVKICKFFHFDGYLINIENPVTDGDKLVRFVKLLKMKLVEKCGRQSEVIWYDAVTVMGKLLWQNRLNDLNKKFFDVCDGIFLNYLWTTDYLKKSATAAGSRQRDVYVGIDVFGRGCFGGGGFGTNKAMEKIHAAGLSVALFAPAWTHECCPVETTFNWREIYFWYRIWNYLYVHGPSYIPFSTSFSVGQGQREYFRGRVIRRGSWFNLSEQEPQISTPYCVHESDGEVEIYSTRCLRIFYKDAYQGGSCLIISRPNDLDAQQHCYIRLFACEFRSDKILTVSFSTKIVGYYEGSSSLSLVLLVEDEVGKLRRYIMAPEEAFKVLLAEDEKPNVKILFTDPHIHIHRVVRPVTVEESKWRTYDFEISLDNKQIVEVGALHLGEGEILLGNLSIAEKVETAETDALHLGEGEILLGNLTIAEKVETAEISS